MIIKTLEVLTVECTVWFSPDIMGPISSKKLTQVCQKEPGSTWMIIKTLGRMFFGQMSKKCNSLDDMGPIMPGEKPTLHSTVGTVKYGGGSVKGQFMLEKPQMSQSSSEEWAEIPPQRCETLSNNYRKHLVAVIAAKCGTTRLLSNGAITVSHRGIGCYIFLIK